MTSQLQDPEVERLINALLDKWRANDSLSTSRLGARRPMAGNAIARVLRRFYHCSLIRH